MGSSVGSMTDAGSSSSRFVVLHYNILCKSLGSNCIPWIMTASEEWREKVEQQTGKPWDTWKDEALSKDYIKHFHKNLATKDYTKMRGLWSAVCRSQLDIPSSLQGVNFVEEDHVTYTDSQGTVVPACTLRGLLRAQFPEEGFGDALYEHLIAEEEEVYQWSVRGPRLYNEAIGSRRLLPTSEVLGDSDMEVVMPDIITLAEYDAATAEAMYQPGVTTTFAEAMIAADYGHILFKDPLLGRFPPSGLAIFWRRSTFELAPQAVTSLAIECGDKISNSVYNFDLMEHWHQLSRGSGNRTGGDMKLMSDGDRRNVALVRLLHKASGRWLWVVNAHLMTTSRDGPKSNEYPGEVRANELRAIREIVAKVVPDGEAVVFAGDFNINAEDADCFAGRAKSVVDGSRRLAIQTGVEETSVDGTVHKTLDWRSRSNKPLRLKEAFEEIHRWGAGVGPASAGGHCTSINAKRTEWIDFLWYSEGMLRTLGRSDTSTPAAAIPDREHGSDHLPIAAMLEFVGDTQLPTMSDTGSRPSILVPDHL